MAAAIVFGLMAWGAMEPPASGWLAAGRPMLTLAAADAMASAAIAEAVAKGYGDVSVCVLDGSGRTLVSKTMPGCPTLPHHLARAKASACILTHACSSRALKDKYVPERLAQLLEMGAVAAVDAGQTIAAVPGAVLCRDASGCVVGAVGVSGASADEDEHLAIAAARAVGLATVPSESRCE